MHKIIASHMIKGGGKFEVHVGLSLVGPSTHCFVLEHLGGQRCFTRFALKSNDATWQLLRQTGQILGRN